MGREEIAGYVSALFTVYIVLIFIRIIISWVPRVPQEGAVGAVARFVAEVTDPYLDLFRRFIPPLGAGGVGLDLSPIIGVFLLLILQRVLVGVIGG